MGVHVIKMPDIGEGIAEVELVMWYVKVGDVVTEDMILADVMTDKATIFRPGEQLTVIAYGTMVWVCEAAARESGIDAEIIDLRSLWPLDLDTILKSVKKTGRCVVVHEATRTCGFGAELVSLVQEHCFYHLEAPIERVTGWDTPYPHAQEWAYFPGPDRVAAAFKRTVEA